MTKIIDLQHFLQYQNYKNEVLARLREMQDELMGMMIQMAVAGKWKKWNDEQPIGTTFEFTMEMLGQIGDNNIDSLMSLFIDVENTIGKLEKNRAC